MNEARQRSLRLDRATGARTRFAADYSITATLSVVPDPRKAAKDHGTLSQRHRVFEVKMRSGDGWVRRK